MLRQKEWLKPSADFIEDVWHSYRVESAQQVAPVLDHMAIQLQDVLLPLLGQLETIGGMDRALNTQPVQESVFFKGFTKIEAWILSAYLAKNPRLNELCNYLLANIKAVEHLESARRCVDYVRSHPLP